MIGVHVLYANFYARSEFCQKDSNSQDSHVAWAVGDIEVQWLFDTLKDAVEVFKLKPMTLVSYYELTTELDKT